jgi:hypothetical protein
MISVLALIEPLVAVEKPLIEPLVAVDTVDAVGKAVDRAVD